MSQVVIGDILPYTQAVASGGQTVFGTNWTANAASDVVVYKRAAVSTPNDVVDVLPYPAGYSVAFIGALQEVQVTLVVPATLGDIVTIIRQTPADRVNLYTNTNFLPSMLNNDFGILTLVDQQAQLVDNKIGPRYNYSAIITNIVDTILPILPANSIWWKNASNTAIEYLSVPAGGIAPANATYLTLTDFTSVLPASIDLSSLGNGIMVNDAGVTILMRSIVGTANQIGVLNGSGLGGNPTINIADNPIIPGSAGMGIPQGTTGQRVIPGTGINFRFNTTLDVLEYWDALNSAWAQISEVPEPSLNGQLIIGKTGFPPVINTLTAGTNITITNGPGTITISSTGGVSPQDIQDQTFVLATSTGGTPNTYTAGFTPPLTTVPDGTRVAFVAPFTNTNNAGSNVTFNPDGLGASPILINTGNSSSGITAYLGAMQVGLTYYLTYSQSQSSWFLENPSNMVTSELLVQQYWTYAVDSGGINTYVISIPTMLVDSGTGDPIPGARVSFVTINANTGASTLVVNGGNVKDIRLQDGSPLINNNILNTSVNDVTYTANGYWVLTSNVSTAGGSGILNGGINTGQLLFGTDATTAQSNTNNVWDDASLTLQLLFAGSNTVTPGGVLNLVSGFGHTLGATAENSTLLGSLCTSNANNSFAFGYGCTVNGGLGFALGNSATQTFIGSFVAGDSVGVPATDTAPDQWVTTYAGGYFFYKDGSTLFANFDPATGNFIFPQYLQSTLGIKDVNGNNILTTSFVASAVNYIDILNAATGSAPTIQALGSDSNIPLNIFSKGLGAINFNAGSNTILSLNPVASAVNAIQMFNAATGNGPYIQADGGDTNIRLTLLGKGTGGVFVQGTGTNDDAPSGYVGEYISSQVTFGSRSALSNNTPADVTNISLTAGDWDVGGNVFVDNDSSALSEALMWISTTSATIPDISLVVGMTSSATTKFLNCAQTVPTVRVSLSTTTSVYLSTRATFTSGNTYRSGYMWARRVR